MKSFFLVAHDPTSIYMLRKDFFISDIYKRGAKTTDFQTPEDAKKAMEIDKKDTEYYLEKAQLSISLERSKTKGLVALLDENSPDLDWALIKERNAKKMQELVMTSQIYEVFIEDDQITKVVPYE